LGLIEDLNAQIARLQTSILTVKTDASVFDLQRAESSSVILTQLLSLRDREVQLQNEQTNFTPLIPALQETQLPSSTLPKVDVSNIVKDNPLLIFGGLALALLI